MAEKKFLNGERAIANAQVPSVSREEPESEIASSSGEQSCVGNIRKPILYDFG